MKNKELRALGTNELQEKLKETYLELMKEKSSVASGSAAKNPGKIKVMRRSIARIKTIMSEVKPSETQQTSKTRFGGK